MENEKGTALNFLMTIVTFGINFALSFFITPYVVEHCGNTYGFVGLANNFISYASLLATTVNSMASRFVTIAIRKKDFEKASRYYKTIFVGDLIVSIILFIPSCVVIIFLQYFFNISSADVLDVKILWLFLFIGFYIPLLGTVYSIVYFATNKLYIAQKKQLEANLIRFSIIIFAFVFLKPSVAFIGLGTMIGNVYMVWCNRKYTHILLPELKLKRSKFDRNLLIEVMSAGVWSGITSLSNILLNGLDLLIVNLCVSEGDAAMNLVAVAKTLPSLISSFFGTISSIFVPKLTYAYAEEDYKKIKNELNFSIKCLRLLSSIPVVFLLLYSTEFFKLYVPSRDAQMLSKLAVLGSLNLMILAPFSGFDNIFVVMNKVKINSYSVLLTSVISIIVMAILLILAPNENIKIYIICGVSVICLIIRGLTFLPIVVAKYLKEKWYYFYPQIAGNMISIFIVTFICKFIKKIIIADSWFKLIICLMIISIISLILNAFLVLKKSDRRYLIDLIKKRWIKKGYRK